MAKLRNNQKFTNKKKFKEKQGNNKRPTARQSNQFQIKVYICESRQQPASRNWPTSGNKVAKKIKEKTRGGENVQRKTCPMSNIRCWMNSGDASPNHCIPMPPISRQMIMTTVVELNNLDDIRRLHRPTEVPSDGLLCDLLWSDPDETTGTWAANDRGVSYTFGAGIVEGFLLQHKFNLIVRAHQVVEDGYEFFADRQLVTIFSAPNYCNIFDNSGAVLVVDNNLVCHFVIIRPRPGIRPTGFESDSGSSGPVGPPPSAKEKKV